MLEDLFLGMSQQRIVASMTPTTSGSFTAAPDSTGTQAQQRVRELEISIDRLRLVCQAMWTLVQDKTNLTEEDLFQRVQDLDLQDGVLDGKIKRTCKQCPQCQRTVSARHIKCIYCGTEITGETVFDQT